MDNSVFTDYICEEFKNLEKRTDFNFQLGDKNFFNSMESVLSSQLGINYNVRQDFRFNLENSQLFNSLTSPQLQNGLKSSGDLSISDPLNSYWLSLSHLSKKIKPLVKGDLIQEFYMAEIKSCLRRFYLVGRINPFWFKTYFIAKSGYGSDVISIDKWINSANFKVIKEWLCNGYCYGESKWVNERRDELFRSFFDLLEGKKRQDIKIEDFENGFLADLVAFPKCVHRESFLFNGIRYPLIGFYHQENTTDLMVTTSFLFSDSEIILERAINNSEILFSYLETFNEPENYIRNKLGLPAIGEGWISETLLYYSLKQSLPNELIIQHGKTSWLGKQHLDIFFPKRGIAIEFQGEQHFYPIDFFGGETSYAASMVRDQKKRDLCKSNNCILIEVTKGYNLENLIRTITQNFQ